MKFCRIVFESDTRKIDTWQNDARQNDTQQAELQENDVQQDNTQQNTNSGFQQNGLTSVREFILFY